MNRLKSAAPRMLRQTAPRVGTVTRSGARSSTARLARMALFNSPPVGDAGNKRRQRRGQRSFDPSDRSGRAKCTTLVQVGPPSIERAPAGVSIDSALDDLSPDNNWICL